MQSKLELAQNSRLTASVIVAENSIVCRWREHSRITSFICSAKYSSSILSISTTQSRVTAQHSTA